MMIDEEECLLPRVGIGWDRGGTRECAVVMEPLCVLIMGMVA